MHGTRMKTVKYAFYLCLKLLLKSYFAFSKYLRSSPLVALNARAEAHVNVHVARVSFLVEFYAYFEFDGMF